MKKYLFLLVFLPKLIYSQSWKFFETSFETAQTFSYNAQPPATWSGQSQSRPNSSIGLSTDFARTGTRSLKITLNNDANDELFYLKREYNWNYLPAGAYVDAGARNRNTIGFRWMRFSVLIPSSNVDFNTPTGIGVNIKEVHDIYNTSSQLYMYQGRMVLGVSNVAANGSDISTPYDCGPVVYDQWMDFILERNYRQNSTGFIRFYRNDTLKVNNTGPNWRWYNYTGSTPHFSKEAYVNFGVYKWAFRNNWSPTPNTNTVTAYFDDVLFADSTATYNQVRLNTGPAPNQPPTVSINTPNPTNADSIQVIAQSSDIDGTITNRAWSRLSGPNNPSQVGTQADTLRLSGLIEGLYIYRLIVTDDDGARDTADVTITVNAPAPGSLGIIFRDDAEAEGKPFYGGANADINQYYNNRVGVTSNVLIRSSEQKNNGNYSYKFSLKNAPETGFQYTDNENVWNFPPATTAIGINWYAASILIPIQNQNDNSPTTVLFNTFPYTFNEDKPMFLDIVNNTWKFKIRKFNSGGTDLGLDTINVGAVAYDTWTNWAVQRNWTLNDSGYVRLYRNKTLIYEYNGPNFNPAGKRPEPYSHWGIWKRAYDTAAVPNKDSIVIFLDDIVVAGYAASLDSVSANLPPIAIIDPVPPVTGTTGTATAVTSDPDGFIASRTWTFVSGPTIPNISGSSGNTLNVTGMTDTGNYVFQITVVDNNGSIATARVTIVKQTSYNNPPSVTAPEELTFTNDATLVVMVQATDIEDGDNLTYQWNQLSGPTATISNTTSKDLIITKPQPGTYQFELAVSDTEGAITIVPVRVLYQRGQGQAIRLPAGPVRVIPKNN